MGAWGYGPFDNDDASDFADEVGESKDMSPLDRALDAVTRAGSEMISAPDASAAIAGAEIVAMLLDRPSTETEYPEEIDEWVAEDERVPSDALVAKAKAAMDRVTTPPSELLDLWSASDDLTAWKASVDDIKRRLAG